MLFSPDVAGLVSTECDGVEPGVSRTLPDLGFPAHTAQEQLLARHLGNHDCANAAPQHTVKWHSSDCTCC